MRQLFLSLLILAGAAQAAPARTVAKDAELKKETSAGPDKSLAGDVKREVQKQQAAPVLQYDQYRLGVEMQVASKRHEQIEALRKIIRLSSDPRELPSLLFRLGELYWEESKFYFFEANRKDDDLIVALNNNDKAGQKRAKAEKAALLAKSKQFSQLAVKQYSEIVQRFKNYERTDEVLYFLGHNLMEAGDERRAMAAFRRLIDRFPKSEFLADAYLAFGEFYFNNSKGKRALLLKALDNYKKAAGYPENQAYGFALYKQGWCYFNLGEHQKAMDMFKAVVLYGELAGAAAVEKDGGKSGKSTLVREARADFVRAYSQVGSPQDARAEFSKLAQDPEDRFKMMKQLANTYYADGKDRAAAMTFDSLIKEKPLSPEAPGFQGKIVDCLMRDASNAGKRRTVNQVRRLVKITQQVKESGVIKEDKDKKALEEAEDLAERTLSNLAVTWHNEAKKTRDDEVFGFANDIYEDYLTLFPESPKAYDLRFFWAELLNDNLQKFEKAAENYTKVLLVDVKRLEEAKAKGKKVKPGKFMVNAAYNAVLANDEVVRRAEEAGKIKTQAPSDPTQKMAFPNERQALLEACERYLKYVPNGDKAVEIAFKVANLYYRHNHFDEAVLRFSEIALKHPEKKFENGERAAEISANLVLDSFNLLGDWAKMNEWARRFYGDPKLAVGKFRADLSKVIEQSSFKLVNQLEAKQLYGKAAEAYLAFVAEFPRSDIADTALHNASVDFFKAKMLDKAISTRQRIISKYPKSKHVPESIYANAEGHEAIGDFEKAARAYEQYVGGYLKAEAADDGPKRSKSRRRRGKSEPGKKEEKQVWDETKAQIALYNAALFRAGLSQHKAAIRDRELYLQIWPDAKDAEAVELATIELYEKVGSYSKALKLYEDYEKKHLRSPSKVLMAEGRILRLYEDKLRRSKDVARLQRRILAYYESLPSRLKKSLDSEALDAVGRSHFAQNEGAYRDYARIKLRWGKLPNPAKVFKAGLAEKAKELQNVQKLYTQTVSFKAADPAICALYRIGQAYDNFADTLINAPMPKGAPQELQDAIRDELNTQAQPVKDKAAEAFAAAVQKAREFDIFNDCSKRSLSLLRDQYRPDQFPPMFEETASLKGIAEKTMGLGLLASIQPVPVLSKEAAQVQAQKSQALQDDLSKLESKVEDSEPEEPEASDEPGEEEEEAEPGDYADEPQDSF